MKERKLVLIEWEDIYTTSSEWRTEDDAIIEIDSTESVVRQVGFLLTEDGDYVVLTCSYIPGLDLVGTTIRIPRAVVKYMKEIPFDEFKNISNKV